MNKFLRKIINNKEDKDQSTKASIIHYFEERLNEFNLEFSDDEVKVTSSNSAVDRLLAILEALFLHGLRESFISQLSTVIGNDVDKNMNINFWHCLLVLSPSGIVDQINSLTYVKTDVGKCRAWIRCTLNDCVFRSFLMSAFEFGQSSNRQKNKHDSSLNEFYNRTAIIRDNDCFKKIITLLESIDKYHFDLTLNSSLLNTWPNSTLMLAGYWTPALKNNPLYNNNPSIAEAVEVSDPDDATLIDFRSEDSYNSSLSSSFIDSEFFRKPPSTIDEDIRWNILMNQPSTSYKSSVIPKNTNYIEASKEEDITVCDIPVIEPSGTREIVTNKEENTSDISMTEQETESIPVNEVKETQSFNELLELYSSRENNSFSPIVENIYSQLVPTIIEGKDYNVSNKSLNNANDDSNDDFEELSMHPEHLSLDLLKQYLKYLFTFPKELGLSSQDYNCKSCNETIGIDFGNYHKCNFTSCYYCIHCFGSVTWPIPVKILFNWDFNRYPVSNSSLAFLNEIQYHPLFNMRSIHSKIYKVNKEMYKSKKLRWKMYHLYHYLSTCKFYDINELSKEVWPRVYFFNNIHLYSFADLQEIYSGTLFEFWERIINTCQEHVYKCVVCSQKGFICEICRDPKIMYPFDMADNYRCRRCKSLFHDSCHKGTKTCPKCERDKIRNIKKISNHNEDEDN